ncbi:PIG-L family deacetylase [bacterium]|nr:PIG-L family deacetylase [bacterium]
MTEIVLVVIAHSDDESISMAGTITRHVSRGDKIIVVSMTDGVGARGSAKIDDVNSRKVSADAASKELGFQWGECYDFNDNAMDAYPLIDVVKAVEKAKNEHKPTLVYTHSCADLNVDHRVVASAVLTAFRPQPSETCREIRLFEVASGTDYGNAAVTGSFIPNLFVDITNNWASKERALKAYSAEMRDYPHSRSVEGIKNLAKLRGNQIGRDMAEAFEVIRKIET